MALFAKEFGFCFYKIRFFVQIFIKRMVWVLMISFAVAVFFLILSPGPGVLSAAGVGAAYGRSSGLSYVMGLWIGNNLVSLLVITGLAALVLAVPYVRFILKIASTGYLLYLALRIGFAGARIGFISFAKQPKMKDGILLQLINPKAYAVNSALFSSFTFMAEQYVTEVVIKLFIFNAIWIPLHIMWLEAGISLRRLSLSAQTTRRINYAMAVSLVIVVILSFASMFR